MKSKSSRKRSAATKVAEDAPVYAARVCYVESSALVGALLEGDDEALHVLNGPFVLVTSELTFAECRRALVRAAKAGRLSSDEATVRSHVLTTFANRCAVISVSSRTLERAGQPFLVEPVRTLDAIHLASIDALEGPSALVTVLTRDQRVRANAIAMGFEAV